MWSMNVMILFLFCYACLSTGNCRVYFVSKNFYNVLHWDPVEPAFPGQNVFYSVQYWRDDEQQYSIKQECQNITQLSCDLTAETPSVHDVYYRAKVMVNGSCLDFTTKFKPLRDTVLGPPLLSTHTTVSTLHVNITLPKGPNGVSIIDIITSSKKDLLKAVPEYTLKITHPQWAAQVFTHTKDNFDINLTYSHSVYCGHVVYIPTPEMGRSVSENASFCVTLPDDPQISSLWPLLGVAVLVGIVIISAVCMCNYVKGGKLKRMPDALVIPSQDCKVMQHQDKNLRLSQVSIGIYQMVQTPMPTKPKEDSNVSQGYFPQAQDTPYNCQHNPDTSTHSSEIYGAVAVHTQVEQNERYFHQLVPVNGQTTQATLTCSEAEDQDKAGIVPQLYSYGALQLPTLNARENFTENQPLVLQTVHINGQLVLPPFTFQQQSNPDAKNTEQEPLLLDSLIICQDGPFLERLDSTDDRDSGCYDSTVNTPTSSYCHSSYSPCETGVPGLQQECQTRLPGETVFQSGYKKNWMPD